MKKLISLLLVLCMLLGVSAALAEDKVELTAFQYALENQNTDFNGLWFFDELEAKTNTHVTFDMVKDADWSTNVNLMFAVPDKMPDMILRHAVDVEEYGVTQGLLLPLDEYLTEEIMPNYVSRLNINNAGDSIPASDGKTYFIGFLMAQNVNHTGTWYVNQAELDKLGAAVPTTIDEVTELLRAMKADGIEYPFSASYTQFGPETIWNQFASFCVPENTYYYYIDENDQVQFTAGQDGWRACVEWLHQLYEEGLMDPESLTQDSNLWANKVNAGQVGYFCYLRLINTAIAAENVPNFKSILPPVADGFKAAVSQILEVPEAGAYLTSNCKDPVAALKWIDAQLETETMMVSLNGKIGEQIVLNDEGKYEVIHIPENNGLYQFVPVSMGQFFAPADYYAEVYVPAAHRQEKAAYCRLYEESGVLEPVSSKYLTAVAPKSPLEDARLTRLKAKLKNIIDAALVTMVTQGVTEENTAQLHQQLLEEGSGEYREIYQTLYDRWRGG